jgi:hypothetical protein
MLSPRQPFLQNVGHHEQDHMVPLPRKYPSVL